MSDKITEDIKKAILKQVQAGVIQPTTIVFGDNVQHKVENNYYGTAEHKQQHELPEVLADEEAMALWQKAQDAKMVDDDYQPLISKTKAALLANEMGTLLKLEPRWSPFENLWGFKNLRNNYQRALESPFATEYIDSLHNLFR